MGLKRVTKKFLKYLLIVLAGGSLIAIPFADSSFHKGGTRGAFGKERIRCVICPGDSDKLAKGYPTGYNYELLKGFAQSRGSRADIFLSEDASRYVDSLRLDSLDILVVPEGTVTDKDGIAESDPVDSSMVWLVKAGQSRARDVNRWMATFRKSENFIPTRDRFFNGYNPYRKNRKKTGIISPYDGLLRVYSKVMGWDWKLFAAMIWQESRFRIQAKSGRGAAGLMQMMPGTAGRYDVENRIDPEESISAGADYLARLQNLFREYAADKDELTKFMLAAYNSGEGRIFSCIAEADSLGIGHAHWDSLKTVPGMSAETAGFVNAVLNQYEKFRAY